MAQPPTIQLRSQADSEAFIGSLHKHQGTRARARAKTTSKLTVFIVISPNRVANTSVSLPSYCILSYQKMTSSRTNAFFTHTTPWIVYSFTDLFFYLPERQITHWLALILWRRPLLLSSNPLIHLTLPPTVHPPVTVPLAAVAAAVVVGCKANMNGWQVIMTWHRKQPWNRSDGREFK